MGRSSSLKTFLWAACLGDLGQPTAVVVPMKTWELSWVVGDSHEATFTAGAVATQMAACLPGQVEAGEGGFLTVTSQSFPPQKKTSNLAREIKLTEAYCKS